MKEMHAQTNAHKELQVLGKNLKKQTKISLLV